MNFKAIMQQAKQMQAKIEKEMKEFDSKEFEFNYKNYITTKIKGSLEIINISINDELVDPDDKTILEEMVVEAINEAIISVTKEKDKVSQASMPKIPGFM